MLIINTQFFSTSFPGLLIFCKEAFIDQTKTVARFHTFVAICIYSSQRQFLNISSQFQDEEGENLKDIYSADWSTADGAAEVDYSAGVSRARNLEADSSPLASIVNTAMKLIN